MGRSGQLAVIGWVWVSYACVSCFIACPQCLSSQHSTVRYKNEEYAYKHGMHGLVKDSANGALDTISMPDEHEDTHTGSLEAQFN